MLHFVPLKRFICGFFFTFCIKNQKMNFSLKQNADPDLGGRDELKMNRGVPWCENQAVEDVCVIIKTYFYCSCTGIYVSLSRLFIRLCVNVCTCETFTLK